MSPVHVTLKSGCKLYLFSNKARLNLGVRLLLELYCVIAIKHVALFTICEKLYVGLPHLRYDTTIRYDNFIYTRYFHQLIKLIIYSNVSVYLTTLKFIMNNSNKNK